MPCLIAKSNININTLKVKVWFLNKYWFLKMTTQFDSYAWQTQLYYSKTLYKITIVKYVIFSILSFDSINPTYFFDRCFSFGKAPGPIYQWNNVIRIMLIKVPYMLVSRNPTLFKFTTHMLLHTHLVIPQKEPKSKRCLIFKTRPGKRKRKRNQIWHFYNVFNVQSYLGDSWLQY